MAGWQDAPLAGGAAPVPGWQSAPLVGAATPKGDFSALYQKYGKLFSLDPKLLQAIAQQESNENPNAIGPTIGVGPDKGLTAIGIMQIAPSTAKDIGATNLTDPESNIMYGARILRQKLNATGDYNKALAAYSGGATDYAKGVLAKYIKLGGDPKALAFAPGDLGVSAAGAMSKLLGAPQVGQQPFGGKGTFGRAPGATQAPDQVANALNNFLVGAAHGGLDVPGHSIAQGVGWLSDKLGATDNLGANVNNLVSDYNTSYSGSPAANSTAGTAGNIAGGIGTAMVTPGAGLLRGAGFLQSAARGLLGGATYGAEQNSASGQPLGQDILMNAGLGGAAGAGLPIAARGAGALYSKLFGRGAGAETGAIAGEVMPPGSPASPDPVAAARARLANFNALGLKGESGPTLGMVGRNPQQWQIEQDTAAQASKGAPLTARFQNINAALKNVIDDIHAGTGATATTPYQAGQGAASALTSKWSQMQSGQVAPAYKAVMKPDNVLSPAAFDELMKSNPLFTVGLQAVRRDPLMAARIEGMPDSSLPVLDRVKRYFNGIEGEAARSGNNDRADLAGNTASDLTAKLDAAFPEYADARAAAEARFGEFDRKTMASIQKGTLEPDDVLHKTLWAGKIADVDALKNALLTGTPEQITRGTAAWNDLRGQTVDRLITAGFGEHGEGKFSPAAFNKAIKTLTIERLQRIFTPEEMATISRMQMAGADAFSEVPFSAVNRSHSGTFLANERRNIFGAGATGLGVVNKASNIAGAFTPVPWTLATRPLETGLGKLASKGATQAALNPNVEAEIAAAARAHASQGMMALLSRLPISNAAAAIYDNRGAQ